MSANERRKAIAERNAEVLARKRAHPDGYSEPPEPRGERVFVANETQVMFPCGWGRLRENGGRECPILNVANPLHAHFIADTINAALSGYSEPPEPPDPLTSTEQERAEWYRTHKTPHGSAFDGPGREPRPVSGYSESGERDREAAVEAMASALDTSPTGRSILDYLDANPEAAATLAAYLRGASR